MSRFERSFSWREVARIAVVAVAGLVALARRRQQQWAREVVLVAAIGGMALAHDQVEHPPFGTNLTYPIEQYSRFHQTSGSTGRPMRWLDTPDSWAWVCKCWGVIFTAAGVGPGEHERALAQIVQGQRREDEAQPGELDRIAAEMAHVGVKGLRTGYAQEDRA